jgi:hypothetical protein
MLDWLKPSPRIDAATLALVARATAAVDPLLKSLPGHERTLAPAVRRAFDYCRELAQAIPGPIPITRAAFASEPLVHALFGSADDIEAMLGRSQCVRTQLLDPARLADGQCCALLGMRRREKTGFGARLTGEVLRVDEPQKVLYFTDHTLAEPSPDLATAYQRLAERMFDGLLKGFGDHVNEVRAERKQLRNEEAMAQVFAAEPAAHTRRLTELRDRLRAAADALQPPRLIETLADYLGNPQASLRLDSIKLAVDRGGVIVNAGDTDVPADTLRFVELTTRDQRRWVVLIAHIDPAEARTAVARLQEAQRHIVI